MKVSVAMTTYNGKDYLIEQLDSIRDQKRKPDEVIICDDCSKDESGAIVKDYIEKNHLEAEWTIIRNENNLGYANNFHKAVDLTTGDIVFFSDQDDIWNDDKISSCLAIMEEHPEINMLASDYEAYYFTEDAPIISEKVLNRMTGDNQLVPIPFNQHNIYIDSEGCTMCIRKGFWNTIAPYWFSGWAHDEFVWKMSVADGSAYCYHHATLKRRLHSNNVSKRKMRDRMKRVAFFETLTQSHTKMLEYMVACGGDKKKQKLMKKNISAAAKRVKLMKNRNVFMAFPLVFKLGTYQYRKSYLVELKMALKG
ncbi:MAG: glycosyltransferase [Lachnospiraceae bacterium]